MRNILLFKLIFILLFLSCAKEPTPLSNIIRTNENSQDLELAFKDFINKTSGIKISLIPMVHIAEKNFYGYVNQKITDKIVLYELYGADYKQFKIIKNKIKNLPSPYPFRLNISDKLALKYDYYAEGFSLEKQNDLFDYSLPKEVIHADLLNDKIQRMLTSDDDYLKKIIDEGVEKLLKRYEDILPYGKDNDEKLIFLDHFFKQNIESLKDLFNLKYIAIDSNKHLEDDVYKNLVIPRDKIVKEKILETISRSNPPKEIVIAYGYLHMVSIEAYLKELGFDLVENSVEWVKAFNVNKPKIK